MRRNLIFFESWREALRSLLNQTENNLILIPNYIGLSPKEGSGILDPIKNSNTDFKFYEIDSFLQINEESLFNNIKKFNPTHLLLVNYFGYINRRRELIIKKIREECNTKIVEDWAHSLLPLYKSHSYSMKPHFSIFSIHKTLPTKHGGALEDHDGILRTFSKNIDFNPIELLKYDYEKIFKIRMSNYSYYINNIRFSSRFKLLIPPSTDISVPQSLPVLCSSSKYRHELYTYLNEVNVYPTSLYHTLVPEIYENNYSIPIRVSSLIVNLPVHQDIDEAECKRITFEVNKFNDNK